jgi:OmpA-OmpF porin, OOP family
MKIRVFAFCISVMLVDAVIAIAQPALSTKSKKAIELYVESDNYRVRGQFPQAIQLLNQAIDKDKNFAEAYYRLGVVYHNMRAYQKAIDNYEKALSLLSDIRKQKVVMFDLGEAYLTIGEYKKASENLSAFLKNETLNKPKIQQATKMFNDARFALENANNPAMYRQKTLSDTVNAFVMQYFPVLTADQQELIFTRRKGHADQYDEDLVVSQKSESGKWTAPQSISKNINSDLNEGTCTISADGRKLIFTSCEGRSTLGGCDLYESIKTGEDWSVPRNLGPGVNTAAWESQPSLSADGRVLYFVSDRRSGLGGRDIYQSQLDAQGKWSRAVNVGKPVNSIYDEISPFIHANNRVLYYATNGLPGFGGYDIYYSLRDSAWSTPKNIGKPINTHEDQFALYITPDGEKGYYAHEETNNGGYSTSKIVEVLIPESERIQLKSNYVKGVVKDKATGEMLAANIELINLATNMTESLVTSDSISGRYLIVLTQGSEYALYINKVGYLFKSLNFNYSEVQNFEPIVINVELEKVTEGSAEVLNNLFFDVDKYELKDKSKAELTKLVRFLSENPKVRIEIGGHTDNSGSRDYNLQLSQKRANSVYQYLQENGVDKRRLVVKGYGPDRPRQKNDTESGRQENRRIEFTIVR